MNWKIEIKPNAEKQYRKLDKKTRKRIKESLIQLEKEENPFLNKNVRALTGELRGELPRDRFGKTGIHSRQSGLYRDEANHIDSFC